MSRPLTARQIDVLRLLAEGKTFAQIAEVLGIARGTVGAHVNAIRTKWSLRGTGPLIARARREGLIPKALAVPKTTEETHDHTEDARDSPAGDLEA